MKIFIYILIYFINTIQNSSYYSTYEIYDLIKYIDNEEVLFYSLIDVNDNLAISSNQGVFELVDGRLGDKISGIKGNVIYETPKKTFSKNELDIKIVDSRNLFNEATYRYEIVNSKLLVFKKTIGRQFLEENSVRTFSENYIGTYSGIYDYNQKRIDSFPSYTNSYIREIEDKVYINYDGLFLYDSLSLKDFRSNLVGDLQINNERIGFALDAIKFEENILLFTTKGVWAMDLNKEIIQLDSTQVDDRLDIGSNPKFIRTYINNSKPEDNRVLYYNNKRLKLISRGNEVIELNEINEEVLDIKPFGQDIIYITPFEVKQLKEGKSTVLTTNLDFHTILPINKNTIALSSNEGLFKYSILENKLTKLISNEFNRLALYTKNNTLYAGTINGYYELKNEEFVAFKTEQPIASNNIQNDFAGSLLIFLLGGFIFVMIFKYFMNKSTIKKEIPLHIKIEHFIDENLKNVNVDLIKSEFNISYRQLSKVLKESPGKTIEKRRRLVVTNMIDKKESFKSISEKTGYSIEYLYKIKVGKKKN